MKSETKTLQGVDKREAVELIRSCLPEGQKKKHCNQTTLDYYAFPEMFGSTAGPFGGIGGRAMTKFTIEVWHCEQTNYAVFFCQGRVISVVDSFNGSATNYISNNLLKEK